MEVLPHFCPGGKQIIYLTSPRVKLIKKEKVWKQGAGGKKGRTRGFNPGSLGG
jgi:hypothetical protein